LIPGRTAGYCMNQCMISLQPNKKNEEVIKDSEIEEVPDKGIDGIQIGIPCKKN